MAAPDGIDPATRYNATARTLHAIIALLVIGSLVGGLLQDDLPKTWNVIPLHKSMGLTILALSVARILWRFTWKTPVYKPPVKSSELLLARLVHGVFYALMLVMPLSWLGPLTTIKSFNCGGMIFCTSLAFSTDNFNWAYSSLLICAGDIVAVNFTCAIDGPAASKKRRKIIFCKIFFIITTQKYFSPGLCFKRAV